MAVRTGTLVWLRDVAITAAVVVAGFIALGAITGHAYVGLPLAAPVGTSNAPQAAIVNPHGPQPDCAACHRAHVAPDPELLVAAEVDSSICVQCHNSGGGEAPMSAHSNMDFLGATEAPFYLGCAECHDPHGSGNRAMIRSNINGLPIHFTSRTGADSFDDGFDDAQHDSVCVACHTTTSHNSAFSTDLIGQGHNPVGTDCTSCHLHGNEPALRAGFMPTGAPTATPTATATPVPPDTPTVAPTDTPAPSPVPPTPTETAAPPPDTPTPTATATETPTPGP